MPVTGTRWRASSDLEVERDRHRGVRKNLNSRKKTGLCAAGTDLHAYRTSAPGAVPFVGAPCGVSVDASVNRATLKVDADPLASGTVRAFRWFMVVSHADSMNRRNEVWDLNAVGDLHAALRRASAMRW